MTPVGFPHSGTPGSKAVCASPGLIAACRALRRLPMPRHPPCALSILPSGEGAKALPGTCFLRVIMSGCYRIMICNRKKYQLENIVGRSGNLYGFPNRSNVLFAISMRPPEAEASGKDSSGQSCITASRFVRGCAFESRFFSQNAMRLSRCLQETLEAGCWDGTFRRPGADRRARGFRID